VIKTKDTDPRKNYPVQIHYIKEEENTPGYFFAFHPDFRASACSATGDTIPEVIMNLAKVRAEVVRFLQSQGKPIPEPSPHPYEANIVGAQRCSFACQHAGKYFECYNTVECKATKKYVKLGAQCVRPTLPPETTKLRCTFECRCAQRLPQKKLVKCLADGSHRVVGTDCYFPNHRTRRPKGKLDEVTKYYLRQINEFAKTRSQRDRDIIDLADEIAANAQHLLKTTFPELQDHYTVRDTLKYAVRVGGLTLRMLTHFVEPQINAIHKNIKK